MCGSSSGPPRRALRLRTHQCRPLTVSPPRRLADAGGMPKSSSVRPSRTNCSAVADRDSFWNRTRRRPQYACSRPRQISSAKRLPPPLWLCRPAQAGAGGTAAGLAPVPRQNRSRAPEGEARSRPATRSRRPGPARGSNGPWLRSSAAAMLGRSYGRVRAIICSMLAPAPLLSMAIRRNCLVPTGTTGADRVVGFFDLVRPRLDALGVVGSAEAADLFAGAGRRALALAGVCRTAVLAALRPMARSPSRHRARSVGQSRRSVAALGRSPTGHPALRPTAMSSRIRALCRKRSSWSTARSARFAARRRWPAGC